MSQRTAKRGRGWRPRQPVLLSVKQNFVLCDAFSGRRRRRPLRLSQRMAKCGRGWRSHFDSVISRENDNQSFSNTLGFASLPRQPALLSVKQSFVLCDAFSGRRGRRPLPFLPSHLLRRSSPRVGAKIKYPQKRARDYSRALPCLAYPCG